MAFFISCALGAQDAPLHITVVSGEGMVHAAGARVAKPLLVRITDGSGHPVEGARVSFQVPEDGPGGVFSTGLRTDLVITDSSGRAAVRGLQLNRVTGAFSIRITAAKEQARAGTVVRQSIGEAGAAPEPHLSAAETTPPAPTVAKPAGVPADVMSQPKDGLESRNRLRMPAAVPTIVIAQRSRGGMAEVGAAGGGGSHKKWIWLGVLAAGAAAGALTAWKMGLLPGLGQKGAAGSPAVTGGLSSAVMIGAPTISVGKP